MTDISKWELKNESKKIAKQKVEEFCRNKYKTNIPGNETLKNIIIENIILKTYINILDIFDNFVFNPAIPTELGNTKEEKLKSINDLIDRFLITGKI